MPDILQTYAQPYSWQYVATVALQQFENNVAIQCRTSYIYFYQYQIWYFNFLYWNRKHVWGRQQDRQTAVLHNGISNKHLIIVVQIVTVDNKHIRLF